MHPVPGPVPLCDAVEPDWMLECARPRGHEGTTHIGANASNTHEGYWGAGVVHVERVRIRGMVLTQ